MNLNRYRRRTLLSVRMVATVVFMGSGVRVSVAQLPNGACCIADGSCLETTSLGCTLQRGLFQGVGTDCARNPCLGACCLADGGCSDVTVSDCTDARGFFQGPGIECSAVRCGACCLASGSTACQPAGAEQCRTLGGAYLGTGSMCRAGICDGACCLPNGSCLRTDEPNCLNQDGNFQGLGAACNVSDCAGACCLPDGTCVETGATGCGAANGTFGGLAATCASTDCSGACCLPAGTCLDTGTVGCAQADGAFAGLAATCAETVCAGACCLSDGACENRSPHVCPPEEFLGLGTTCGQTDCVGACCRPAGDCLETSTTAACETVGGEFRARGTRCESTSCLGACCLPQKACVEMTSNDCSTFGGAYQGGGTTCLEACPRRVSTTITYQGQLRQSDLPYSGFAHMRFSIWDLPAGGLSVAVPIDIASVEVVNGLFQVKLDFGEAAFQGNARWLEIAIQSEGGGDLVTVSPRQEVTLPPYAQAMRLPINEQITSSAAAFQITNLGFGPAARFTGPDNNGVTAVLQVASGGQTMLMDGNELDSLDPGGLFLNSNVSGNVILASGGGRVGVGTSSPAGSFSVGNPAVLNVFVPGDSNCFAASAVPGCSDAGCQALVCATDAWCCNNSWDNVCVGEANTLCIGRVGIGTSSPEVRLHVTGGTDASPDSGGFLVLGNLTGANIVIDNNEIMARNNEAPAALAINPDGGNVHILQFGGGNVGIGTASPSALLHAVGDAALDRGVVYGVQNGGSGTGAGVFGLSTVSSGNGVIGEANTGATAIGVWGKSSSGEAGHFSGNVDIVGSLSKNSGSFRIDHPLDPANKYLYHSFVESPDMMNIYNGNVVTDSEGYATITLPDWFEALNRDFRYQLTVLDDADSNTFVMAKVVRKMAGNQFTIRTSKSRVEVSWQVTGVRQDAWANAHRVQVEVDKPARERGFYRSPELFGQPLSKHVEEALRPGSMTRGQESAGTDERNEALDRSESGRHRAARP